MGDTPAELIGAGVVRPGEVLLYYGTTTSADVCTHDFEAYLRDPGPIVEWAPYREVAYAVLGPVLPWVAGGLEQPALADPGPDLARLDAGASRITPSLDGPVRRAQLPRPRSTGTGDSAPGDHRPRHGPLTGRPPPGGARVVRLRDPGRAGVDRLRPGGHAFHRDRRRSTERVLAPARERHPRSRADVAADGRRRVSGARRSPPGRRAEPRCSRPADGRTRKAWPRPSRNPTGIGSRARATGRGFGCGTRSRPPAFRPVANKSSDSGLGLRVVDLFVIRDECVAHEIQLVGRRVAARAPMSRAPLSHQPRQPPPEPPRDISSQLGPRRPSTMAAGGTTAARLAIVGTECSWSEPNE